MRFHPRIGTALALLSLCACASTPSAPAPEPYEYDPNIDKPAEPEPIGKLLVDLDAAMRAWTSLELTAESKDAQKRARGLELDIRRRVKPRTAELIVALESGPPYNRMTAATALGFTAAPEAQSPLLAALHDEDTNIVGNALLGLAILQLPDTPMGPIVEHMRASEDSFVRSNAAYAVRSLLHAGADGSVARDAAREALTDSQPFVRAQAALILAMLSDSESLQQIGELCTDQFPLVAQAACRAVAGIGRQDMHSKGAAAKILAKAMSATEDEGRRQIPHRELVRLAEHDYGEEPKEWLEWAYKLP